jgi:hypothetical protein
MNKTAMKFWILLSAVFVSSCGTEALKAHPRDDAFYRGLVNEKQSPKKVAMSAEKIFYSDDYPMRFALYNDQRFFYQVDELGDGWGRWVLEDGVMKLFAPRPFFDMNLVVSGAEATGDTKVLRFRDRTGIQSIKVSLRDPEVAQRQGQKLPELRKFKANRDGF